MLPTATPSTLTSYVAAALPTSAPGYGSDRHSEQIYAALLAAAQKAAQLSSTPLSTPVEQVTLEHAVVLEATTSQVGFITSRLGALPSPIPVFFGLALLILGLAFAICGARSLIWLNCLGKPRGTYEGRPYIAGGIGGVLFGGVAMVALVTFFILLVSSRQTTPSLGKWGVLAVTLSTAPLGCFVGGRYRWAARAFTGLLGGLSLTLLLITTSKLGTVLPRLVLAAIVIPAALILALLPATLRSLTISAAVSGAYLFVLGIDMFTRCGLLDALSLLVDAKGVGSTAVPDSVVVMWNEAGTKGLIAGWWLISVASGTWQWYWGGEGGGDVDEAWNAYLDDFVNSNPDPRGTFTPHVSFLRCLFSPRRRPPALTNLPGRRRNDNPWDDSEKGDWDSDADTIAAPVQYGVIKRAIEDEEDDEEARKEEEGWRKEMAEVKVRAAASILNVTSGFSSSTDVGEQGNTKDNEQNAKAEKKEGRMRGLFASRSTHRPTAIAVAPEPTSWPMPPVAPASSAAPVTSSPPNAVPVTPSLLYAIQRINEAQRQARRDVEPGPVLVPEPKTELIPKCGTQRRRGQSWDEFWSEVVEKADGNSDRK